MTRLLPLLMLSACTCGRQASTAGATNVLVILADDLGPDNVSSWGVDARSAKTPTLDRLGDQGVRFRNAWSYAECSPTRAALLTGRYGRRTGVGQRIPNTASSAPYALSDDEVFIPEMLDRAPVHWASSATGKWHLANENWPTYASHANDNGFDWFGGSVGNLDGRHARFDYYNWEKVTNGVVEHRRRYATVDTTDDAIARTWDMPEPWFLYVPYNAPHAPFHSPPPALVETVYPRRPAGLYRAAVEAMDHEIGRLLDEMDPEVLARTTVIVVGDNGTPRDAVLPPLDPKRGKASLYEGGARVPMIVSGPLVKQPGWSDALVHVVDILPTVAAIAGVDLGSLPPIDGQSLLPFLADPAAPGREFLYGEKFQGNGGPPYAIDQRAVRDQHYKLIRTGSGTERMYDLVASGNPLLEGEDLIAAGLSDEQAAAHARLSAAMDRFAETLVYAHPGGPEGDDPPTRAAPGPADDNDPVDDPDD